MGQDSCSNNPHILQDAGSLKLGINATFLNEKPTGVGVFTREVSSRLCSLDKETIVFASADMDGCAVRRTPSGIRGSVRLNNNIKRFLYMNVALPCLIKKHSIDVLFCPITEFPFVALSRLIVTVHDLHPVYFPEQFGLSAAHFTFSLKLLNKLAARVIVPSNFVKSELLKFTELEPDRIDVIYEGYDFMTFRPQPAESRDKFLYSQDIRRPYILFVGSLFPYKNVITLVKAFLAIKDRMPHMLLIAGKKEVSREVLPEDERIRYMDYVRHSDLPSFYSFAEMLVHPSMFEGFGITILEAMACGAPVLSSNRGSLPEVAGDAALLFDPKDTDRLAELILGVINNKDLRGDMIKKGFENIKRFSWEKTAEGILKSCERALREK